MHMVISRLSDKQYRLSLKKIFFDSSNLITLHPWNSAWNKFRLQTVTDVDASKNCYRKISKVALSCTAYRSIRFV